MVFILTVVVLVVTFAAPISAASSFPDSLANILDCSKLFSVLGKRLATSLVSFSSNAAVGTCSFVSSTTQRDSIASNYLGTIKDFCPSIKSGVWYTFHYKEDGVGYDTHFAIVWEHYSRKIMNGDVFMLSEEELTTPIFVECYNIRPDGVVRTVSHLAIIASPLPLSGSFTDETYPAYFNYDQEIDDTKQEVLDQVDSATLNIFEGMTVTGWVGIPGEDFGQGIDESQRFMVRNIPYTISSNGSVYLAPIFSYLRTRAENSFPDYDFGAAFFELRFDFAKVSDNQGSWVYADGPIVFHSSNMEYLKYGFDFSTPFYDGYKDGSLVLGYVRQQSLGINDLKILGRDYLDDNGDITISSISFRTYYGYAYDFENDLSLCMSSTARIESPLYGYGYAQGYLDGQRSEFSDAQNQAYDQGYNVGYVTGKKEGLSLASTGDWQHLFTSVVEVPVNTFQSLFNFEILGLDMRAAFGSLLALCVLLIIVKKVLL